MDMLKRFSLVVHWGSFAFGVLYGLFFILAAVLPDFWNRQPEINDRLLDFFLGIFLFFSGSGLGWLARFVLVGKVHFLPWRKLDD